MDKLFRVQIFCVGLTNWFLPFNIVIGCEKCTCSKSDASFGFFSRDLHREIADLVFNVVTIESKLREESATIIFSLNSVEMVDPCCKKCILLIGKVCVRYGI